MSVFPDTVATGVIVLEYIKQSRVGVYTFAERGLNGRHFLAYNSNDSEAAHFLAGKLWASPVLPLRGIANV